MRPAKVWFGVGKKRATRLAKRASPGREGLFSPKPNPSDSRPFSEETLLYRRSEESFAKSFTLRLHKISVVRTRAAYHYPAHRHALCELIIPRRGAYRCAVNGAPLYVRPGEAIFVQTGDAHEDFYPPDATLLFLMFDLFDFSGKPWVDAVFKGAAPAARVIQIAKDAVASTLVERLLERGAAGGRRLLALETGGEAVFWQILSRVPDALLAPGFVSALDQSLFHRRVMDYFREHVHERLSVPRMALHLGVSKRKLEYEFKSIFGSSPAHSFLACKMNLAAEWIEKGARIREVSSKLGFSDPLYFSTAFKRIKGYPPSRIPK